MYKYNLKKMGAAKVNNDSPCLIERVLLICVLSLCSFNQSVFSAETPEAESLSVSVKTTSDAVAKPLTYQQSQAVMLKSAPPIPLTQSADSEAAFGAMLRQNMPLNPEQVVRLRQLIDASQRAAAIPANIPPKPVSSTVMVNLAPGATPPAIRLSQGYVSSLVFVDSTGAPWPIISYDVGNPKSLSLQWDNKGNVLTIQALEPYTDSNIVIRLSGLMTPISLALVSGQRVVDYRADIHVPGLGPNAKDLPMGTSLPGAGNVLISQVLEGISPPGAKLITVHGGDCQAWSLGDKLYLRTRLTVLSPAWTSRMVSPDEMIAYELPKSTTVLVSQYGEPVELKIEGY
jgi:intracellular multiplication protein IcmK